MILLITSVDNNKIKELNKLKTRKYRKEEKKFLIEGYHLVEEAYKKGILLEVLVCENSMPEQNDIPCTYISANVMSKLSSLDTNPEIIGICKLLDSNDDYSNKILMLDNVQDPGNLGTILRSSLAFGFDTVILSPDTVDVYNSKVLRATQGTVFNLNIIINDLEEEINKLKYRGYKVLGTDVTNGKSAKDFKGDEKIALIMGNEGNGVRQNILDLCDDYLHIETSNKVESLNVAVATSILLYELR